jgi:hypothetical protein
VSLNPFHKKDTSPEVREKRRQQENKRVSTIHGRATRMLTTAKSRAKRDRLKIDLDYAWLLKKLKAGRCEVTDVVFDLAPNTHGYKTNLDAPSIDRIDSKKGYLKSNCQLVTWQYNAAKNEGTHTDVVSFSLALLKQESLRRYKDAV